MIHVEPPEKPTDFDEKVGNPGALWLTGNPITKRPSPLWNCCLEDLSKGFRNLCGYAAMLDPTGGTVDHYLSCKSHRNLAYDWTNYRFASGPLNSSKKTADSDVLDPFEVGDGWFEILLPSLQMQLTGAVPAAYRAKAEYTLTRLRLRDGERVIRWRRSWYKMYQEGKLTLEGLREVAPLIADAVDKKIREAHQNQHV